MEYETINKETPEMKQLISGIKGLTSKAGKKFNARLVLQEDSSTTFEFEQKRKK